MSLVQSSGPSGKNSICDQVSDLLHDMACRAEDVQKLADNLLSRHTIPEPKGPEQLRASVDVMPPPMPTWPEFHNLLRAHAMRIDRALEQIRNSLNRAEI